MARFAGSSQASKVHWPLDVIDAQGRRKQERLPRGRLPEGDLLLDVARKGPDRHVYPPTSGNAWSRRFLEQVLPMPEEEYRLSADAYLAELAPLFGPVLAARKRLGSYRIHGENRYISRGFGERLELHRRNHVYLSKAIAARCRQLGYDVDLEKWERNSWFCRLDRSVREIKSLVPPGESFILVDQDDWGTDRDFYGRTRIPFLERNGEYWGNPADDAEAIRELERLLSSHPSHIIFAWPEFWYLDYYVRFHDYLRTGYPLVLENKRLRVFDLGSGG